MYAVVQHVVLSTHEHVVDDIFVVQFPAFSSIMFS